MILTGLSSCSTTGSIRDDLHWTSRKNSLELIDLSIINTVSFVKRDVSYRSVNMVVVRLKASFTILTLGNFGTLINAIT